MAALPKGGGAASLIVQLKRIPEAQLAGLGTAKERIDFMTGHLSGILDPILRKYRIGREQVKTLGTIGQVIIQAEKEMLEALVESGGDLAKSEDLKVLPNKKVAGGLAE